MLCVGEYIFLSVHPVQAVGHNEPLIRFLLRDAMHARYNLWPCVCLCLCLRLSQVGVLLKRLNTGSHKQHHTIVQGV